MANYKSGMKMQMGSKQKNTPSNFSERSAMLLTGEPSTDFFQNIDPGSSLGNDVENQYDKAMSGYSGSGISQQNININPNSNKNQNDPKSYASLGSAVNKLLKPQSETAKANQKYRQDKRAAKRKKQGGTVVGNKLRSIFGTGNKNKNLQKY